MREIKFRVWDPKEKIMDYTWGCMGDQSLNGEIRDSQTYGLVFLQYTGLKDKNGKEIYDGDVLRWKDLDVDYPESYTRAITFDRTDSPRGPYRYSVYGYFFQLEHDKGEILGNIYENPELVECK